MHADGYTGAASDATDPLVLDFEKPASHPPPFVLRPDQILSWDCYVGEELLTELGTPVDLLDRANLHARPTKVHDEY
jgi:hypothetical protein